MWVPRVVPRLWAAFSVHAQSPGLVPFCDPHATCHSTPCLSPVGRPGLRLGRGHFWSLRKKCVCFPPSELLQSSSSGDSTTTVRYPNIFLCRFLVIGVAGRAWVRRLISTAWTLGDNSVTTGHGHEVCIKREHTHAWPGFFPACQLGPQQSQLAAQDH